MYVDDILITGDYLIEIASLKNFLNDTFQIKDLGNIGYFLGLEFSFVKNGLVVHQQKYI